MQAEFYKKLEAEKHRSANILEAALREEKLQNEKERSELRSEFQSMFNER